MNLSRRTFTGGALSLVLGSQLAFRASAQARPELAAAIEAIRTYGQMHLEHFYLPGMTLGLVTPDGARTLLNFGHANRDARTPITPDTLFQIGSISKVMVAALLHQYAAEGRIRLTDRLSDLLPSIPFPKGNAIQVQHMLDHVAGLPGDAPVFKSLADTYRRELAVLDEGKVALDRLQRDVDALNEQDRQSRDNLHEVELSRGLGIGQ